MKNFLKKYWIILLCGLVIVGVIIGASLMRNDEELLGTAVPSYEDVYDISYDLRMMFFKQLGVMPQHYGLSQTLEQVGLSGDTLPTLITLCGESFGVDISGAGIDLSSTPVVVIAAIYNARHEADVTADDVSAALDRRFPDPGSPEPWNEDSIEVKFRSILIDEMGIEASGVGASPYATLADLGGDETDAIAIAMACDDYFDIYVPAELYCASTTYAALYTAVVNAVLGTSYTAEDLCGPDPGKAIPAPSVAPTPTPAFTPDASQFTDGRGNVQYRMFASSEARQYGNVENGGEYYTSEIVMLACDYDPAGTMACTGLTCDKKDYPELASLLGKTYSLDDYRFRLPDLGKYGSLSGIRYAVTLSGAMPDYEIGEAMFKDDIVFAPVDFVANVNYLMGEVILVKEIDEEAVRDSLLPCDGRLLQISQYAALYSVIGTRFGGDDKTTFALPDYSKLTPPVFGAKYYIRVFGSFPLHG